MFTNLLLHQLYLHTLLHLYIDCPSNPPLHRTLKYHHHLQKKRNENLMGFIFKIKSSEI